MTETHLIADLSQWVVQLAFWCSLAFIAWYSIWAPWWRSQIGRAIIAMDSAVALATGPATIGLIFGAALVSGLFFQWLTVAALGAIPVITTWRMIIVYKIQRRPFVEGRPRRTLMARISDQHHHAGEPDSDAG